MPNTFGHLFRITTWGESHGGGVGVVVDGCPPRIPLTAADIQVDLDRRRPGQSKIVTPRKESDTCEILSGIVRRPDARHAHRHSRAQRGPAGRGLQGDGDALPALARRLHLPGQVRHPRGAGRRPRLGTRDHRARGGRRGRAADLQEAAAGARNLRLRFADS